MEFENPSDAGFTIYSKSGCPNCLKVKALLKEKNIKFKLINSDDYIIEDKENFLNYIKQISKTEVKTFPMIFYDKEFIGGYIETLKIVDELMLDFDNAF
jgi:glutaredoxin 3